MYKCRNGPTFLFICDYLWLFLLLYIGVVYINADFGLLFSGSVSKINVVSVKHYKWAV